ncbi:helix-turn-helix transcriptional regulator [Alicyclobacillus curvatus]|nr:helix-turn-helix transcriptional regulator [Alicyclobacillus curvatus]
MTPEEAFGTVIRRHRKELEMSQEELALRCDLDRTFIGLVERGKKSPSLKTVRKIAESLNVKISVLFKEVEQELDTYENPT